MRLWILGVAAAAACGNQRGPDGVWKIAMADQCNGSMIIGSVDSTPGIDVVGVWSCNSRQGDFTGQFDGGTLHLEMNDPFPAEMHGRYSDTLISGSLLERDGGTSTFTATR